MKCENALELLSASLDGALTPAEEETLQAHLQQCPRCRALQAELMGIHTACGELDAAVPAGLKERILSALPPQKATKSRHWQRWGAMAAALAIIAMAAWRLPHDLYTHDESLPQGNPSQEAAVEPRSGEMATQTTGTDGFMGYDTVDDEIPPYVVGEGVNVNAYVPSPAATADAETPAEAAVYKALLDENELESAKFSSTTQTSAVFDLAGSMDEESGVAVHGDADAGAEVAPVSVGPRMATGGMEKTALTDGVDAVLEDAPVMNEAEWSVAAEQLEPVTEVADEFAVYCGVLTLEGYQLQRDYPALLLENGDTWYSLPAQDFAELIETLDKAGQAYELRLSGDDISADAPEGLVIVLPQVP